MILFKYLKIKGKLTLIIIFTSVIGLLMAGAGFIGYDQTTFKKTMVSELSVLARVIADRSTAALAFMDQNLAEENLSALKAKKSIVFACVYDESGAVFATFINEESAGPYPSGSSDKSFSFDQNYLHLFQPILIENDRVGTVYIRSDLRAIHERLYNYALIVATVVIFSGIVAFFFSTLLQKLITRPLAHLATAAKGVAERKDYSVRVEKESEDELGLLVDAFNEMLYTIEKQNQALQEGSEKLELRVAERTRALSQEIVDRKKAEEKVKKAKEEVEAAERFKAGLNDLSITMQGIQDTKILSEKVLLYMVDYLKLPLGAFFALNGENKLIRSADFGYPKKENLPDSIGPGSGLVGQAAVEGKPITLRDIPDYAKASFGFGEVSPEEIFLFPLLFNNQTVGVLELGSFKAFTVTQLNWIEEAGRSISVVLRATLDNIDRKRHAEMLKKSEERLELVLEGGGLGFWDVNLRNMKTVVNKRWAENLGYTLEEVEEVHSLWEKNIHPDDRERVLQFGKDYREGRIPNYEVEYRMYTKEGEIKWLLSKGAIVESDEQGVPTRMVGTVMDVTDRRRWKTVDSEAVRKEGI